MTIACAAFAAQCGPKSGQGWNDATSSITIASPLGAPKPGRSRLEREERPLGGRVEGGVPVLLGDLIDRPRLESGRGGADHDVETAELRCGSLDERPCLLGAGQVAVRAAGREHSVALALEPRRDRPPDSAGSAGDERGVLRFGHDEKDKLRASYEERRHRTTMATLAFNHEEIAARELRPELYDMDGISRASVEAHYKLYQGYVNKRNEILRKLGEVDLSAANQVYSEVRALKVDLTFAIGGVKNHEVYFEHLGGGGGDPDGLIGDLIQRDFGSVDAWRDDLKATGMAARGWAWTAYDWDEERLFNYIGDAQNTFPIWNATPLVALDVYEHAYFLDYQTDRASYIDAFFGNLDWGVVNEWVSRYQIQA